MSVHNDAGCRAAYSLTQLVPSQPDRGRDPQAGLYRVHFCLSQSGMNAGSAGTEISE